MNRSFVKEKKPVSIGQYFVSAGPDKIFIRHDKSNKVIYINRDSFEIGELYDYNEYLNRKNCNEFQVDSIIGILNIDNQNKYILFVSSSIIAAKFKGNYIYNIDSINYLKINFQEKTQDEIKRINEIQTLFKWRHFYYSNTYNISKSLQTQDNQDNNNFLFNDLLLNDFRAYNVPMCFYNYIIFGYVGGKIDVEIITVPFEPPKKIDFIIIERYHKDYMLFREDIARQIRQVELLTILKLEQKDDCVFSTILYISNEIYYQNIKSMFNPYNPFIKRELDNYEKIICILNDIYIQNNYNLTDFIHRSDELKNKIELINLVNKDWKPGVYFESNDNCIQYLTSFCENLNIMQEKAIWLVDINNNMVKKEYMNEKVFHALIRILWIIIQKQMNNLNWNTNIGIFGAENKTNLGMKYGEIIESYFQNVQNKKYLYNINVKNVIQNLFDKFFIANIKNSVNNSNSLRFSNKMSFGGLINNQNENNNNVNNDKLNILCITWNVDDIPIEDKEYTKNMNIKELFTKNSLYGNNILPDIIFISLQKLVKINESNKDSIKALHRKRYTVWANGLKSYIENLYSNCVYIPLKCADFLGNCFISFIKCNLKDKITFKDLNTYNNVIEPGNKGDKGFIHLVFQYKGNNISVSSAFFDSKSANNNKNLELLNQVLNTKINIGNELTFKDSDFWIILGDLNFKVDLEYEATRALIDKNNSFTIANNDQFKKNINLFDDFNLVGEGDILFNPTYKFQKGNNIYHAKKVPSYTDRIFYGKGYNIKNLYYNSANNINYSSHKPVIGVYEIDTNKK